MNFKSLMVTVLLIGLFSFAFLSFAVKFTENASGTNSTLLQNSALNASYNSVSNSLDHADDVANSTKKAFDADTPTLTAGFFLLTSIINGAKLLGSVAIAIYDSTLGLIASTLGISSIVLGVFVAILLIVILIAAYTLYKQGDTGE